MNDENKVAFRLTDKQLKAIDKIKQKSYYNRTYSDLLRYLIDKGIEAEQQTAKKGE